MRPVLPLHLAKLDELQVGFVHQCRGVQSVVSTFTAKPVMRQFPKLIVEHRQESFERLLITFLPAQQHLGNIDLRRHRLVVPDWLIVLETPSA